MANIFLFGLVVFLPTSIADRGDSVGCYPFKYKNIVNTHTGGSVDTCLSACEQIYFKYAIIANNALCHCGNSPGDASVNDTYCDYPCPKNVSQSCGGTNHSSVYDTDVNVPGPPTQVKITNITETSVHIYWSEPDAHLKITGYTVKASPISTYSPVSLNSLEWVFSNSTMHSKLLNLHPGTKYNISVQAIGLVGTGKEVREEIETIIGIPEPTPPAVEIIERHTDTMSIRVPEATNVNGPVSKYRIIVLNANNQQGFMPELLKSYYEAKDEEIPYYITAEIDPLDIENEFIIGNRRTYNGYYNAPLEHSVNIEVSVGIVSIRNNVIRVRYPESAERAIILNVNEEEEVSSVVMGLGVAVAIGVVLLLIGVGILILLRKKIHQTRRYRSSQSLPLNLSEPCFEIENSVFMIEEEERVDHYGNLKRQLWNIPRNFLEINNTAIVGIGSFGKFVSGRVQQNGTQTPTLVQAIADKDMDKEGRRAMLRELDSLIKSNGHTNVIALVGICEIPEMLYVVLEYSKQTLKEVLLSSRQRDFHHNKFSTLNETRIIQFATDIAKGMQYLASKKIFHRRLCCSNVIVVDGMIPKICGFGLSHMQGLTKKLDYTRWTAQEMFQQTRYNTKSDTWSYGCVQWEIYSLGGTLYPQVATKDVALRLNRGMRPNQLPYIGDELYQICLQCWQIDLDERPTFDEIVNSMEKLNINLVTGLLSFTCTNNFDYEPYNELLEVCSQ